MFRLVERGRGVDQPTSCECQARDGAVKYNGQQCVLVRLPSMLLILLNSNMKRLPSLQIRLTLIFVALLLPFPATGRLAAAPKGKLTLRVVDKESREPLATRMHLKNSRGKPVLPKGTVRWKNHFVFDGEVTLELSPGLYSFELEHGPEYRIRTGEFEVVAGADEIKTLDLERYVDMRREGWWSGDLHIHRDPQDIDLLTRAEDLHIAPVITWWNRRNLWAKKSPPNPLVRHLPGDRWIDVMAGEDERAGGALLFFRLQTPLPIATAEREFPCSVKFLKLAKRDSRVHVDIEKPFWWDVPLWLSTGQVDSIGIVHNHLWRDKVLDNEAWGKKRDRNLYPPPSGNALWSQDIYYHILDCGLRIPPSAGSASGVHPNPVGYNRVYVHTGDECSYDQWLENLRRGRVVVTNGPMLRPKINGALPGEVFRATSGDTLSLEPTLKLALREHIDYLQYVKDGKVIRSIRLSQVKGSLPSVEFKQSGWFLIRAVAEHPKTFRFASSGPYYVEFDGKRRVSKRSAQFFLDWLTERARQLPREPAEQFQETIEEFRAARDYWKSLVAQANAE